jgi:hypothetical protein
LWQKFHSGLWKRDRNKKQAAVNLCSAGDDKGRCRKGLGRQTIPLDAFCDWIVFTGTRKVATLVRIGFLSEVGNRK